MCWSFFSSFFKSNRDDRIWKYDWLRFDYRSKPHYWVEMWQNDYGVEKMYWEWHQDFYGLRLTLELPKDPGIFDPPYVRNRTINIKYNDLQIYSDKEGWSDVPEEVKTFVYRWLDYAWREKQWEKHLEEERAEKNNLLIAQDLLKKAGAPHGFGEALYQNGLKIHESI